MRQSTLEKKIKAGKTEPKFISLDRTGTKILFVDAGKSKDYISYLVFEDEYGRHLGSLDQNWDRKKLRQLQRWVDKTLRDMG